MASDSRPSFAALLRRILAQEQHRKLKDVAAQVGLSPRNFYGRVAGRIQFTPDEIARVLRAVPDPRLGEWLLEESTLTCTHRVPPAPLDPTASALDLAMSGAEEGMAALRSVMHLPAAPSEAALTEAETHILEAQRQLAGLQLVLRAYRAQDHGGGALVPTPIAANLAEAA